MKNKKTESGLEQITETTQTKFTDKDNKSYASTLGTKLLSNSISCAANTMSLVSYVTLLASNYEKCPLDKSIEVMAGCFFGSLGLLTGQALAAKFGSGIGDITYTIKNWYKKVPYNKAFNVSE